MIKISKLASVLAAAMFSSVAWSAQYAIGTSGQGTATYGIGSAMASVLAKDAGDSFVVQPHGGTGKIVPLVNTGKVDYMIFGKITPFLSNPFDMYCSKCFRGDELE